MRRFLAGITTLLVLLPVAVGRASAADKASKTDTSVTAAQQFDALLKQYNGRRNEAAQAWKAATTVEDKARAVAAQPKIEDYAPRILALVDAHRHESFTLKALLFVFQRSDAGPSAEHVLDLLLSDFIASEELSQVATGLVYSGSPTVEQRLRTLLTKSPNHIVQGLACLSLARCIKMKPEQMPAPTSSDVEACNREAEALLHRVSEQYGDVQNRGQALKDAVPSELYEIRHLSIGQMAPEIASEDVNGQRMNLSDYRGKAVMVSFWGYWCSDCRALFPHERAVFQRLHGKPFALLGVNSDANREALKPVLVQEHLGWRSWWNGGSRNGPISTQWNIQWWPTVYLIDAKGVIRFKNPEGKRLDDALDKLVAEIEHAGDASNR